MTDDNKQEEYLDTDDVSSAPQSELALELRPKLEKILNTMLENEVIEFEPENREILIQEMTAAAENARRPKAILKDIMYALIKSDNVEEIYGSDDELLTYIQNAVAV